jgi:hypothetical protein
LQHFPFFSQQFVLTFSCFLAELLALSSYHFQVFLDQFVPNDADVANWVHSALSVSEFLAGKRAHNVV